MVLPLRQIIENGTIDKASVLEALSSFSCKRDADVQNFLQKLSIPFEEKRQAATFLLFNDDAAAGNRLQLDGYFSLALKVFSFEGSVSKRQKQKIAGKSDDQVPAYLVGQLARSDVAPKGTGAMLLELAVEYIKTAQTYVGGRLVYLDCKDNLLAYYESKGFRFIQKNPDNEELNQMYIVI